jgi:hypothetical protein
MMNFAAHVTNIKNKAEEKGFITLCIVKSKKRPKTIESLLKTDMILNQQGYRGLGKFISKPYRYKIFFLNLNSFHLRH